MKIVKRIEKEKQNYHGEKEWKEINSYTQIKTESSNSPSNK
jgi:hypothetical protein